ncbi:Hypothetical protein ADU72_1067 [Pediococcus damnosus]|uniref:Uncharacterized protein n=2 Tax=Pediococcus damnosus TaxID=51663 RepID=A0A0R2HTM8_9LACO|nr:hypothetical protein [Pediococcus damnosus]AMV63108.1 Hypothetical protein ADU70_1628 [Pediococcus damnosus]AMV67000.1 Hypothetical protein ADU72_1067 [Pediococcus damnosus]AMV69400.1 Hypothetical protein ADU73_0994 [Pediococcus damnosus]KJU74452.1 hypothetical protein AH70_06610 [Pediococcus damnosus LMG 28219]KRN53644.1 hypothetical protein IV84_GL001857 [Pediococcus damnosus]
MEFRNEAIFAMKDLSVELNKYHYGSETAKYVRETLAELQKNEGVAFTGTLQVFFNRAPVVKLSESVEFNESEEKLWRNVFSFNNLGNNLWGARL